MMLKLSENIYSSTQLKPFMKKKKKTRQRKTTDDAGKLSF